MTTELIITLVAAVLSSSVLTQIASAIIKAIEHKRGKRTELESKIDNLCDKVDQIEIKVNDISQSAVRTELMLLMNDYSDNWEDINELAKRYFVELEGDSYIAGLYSAWLNFRKLKRPAWFEEVLKKEGRE